VMEEIRLYSDGGGEKDSSAAGACIVELLSSNERLCLAAYLGGATNNEAEITAALLGFSCIRSLASSRQNSLSIRWISDSEYVLKSALSYIKAWQQNGWRTANKKPVKNQGLWRTYLFLGEGLEIAGEHVRGHSGHPENEACDAAAGWLRENWRDAAAELKSGGPIDIPKTGETWLIFDGRPFLQGVRQDNPNRGDMLRLEHSFQELFDSSKQLNLFSPGQTTAPEPELNYPAVAKVIAQLKLLSDDLSRERGRSHSRTDLQRRLSQLIKDFG